MGSRNFDSDAFVGCVERFLLRSFGVCICGTMSNFNVFLFRVMRYWLMVFVLSKVPFFFRIAL